MIKMRFSSRLVSDEITTRGYKVLIFIKYITIMIVELTVKSGMLFGMIFGIACGTV
jgi:hypothetical protein